ncbi:septum site-determining protein MinC [Serratia microhaemolytica]|uniref:septum site-determining protein MinC n=1 Tax=Serratia microhaemolytica TaxID=2675110 RepID=UPI000FDD6F91|nr:septum site-determining protein MinC [Serratia microhaemolytica]
MSQSPIELKGSSFTLSVVHLHSATPEVIQQALQEKVSQAPAFFNNAPVVINVAHLKGEANWRALQQAVSAVGLHVVGISGCQHEQQKRSILRAGLVLINEGRAQNIVTATASQPDNHPAKTRIINTPVRSGQQIYARNGDLIITSSVSAGAELIADGNVHIYGSMRGRVLAGASGDTQCQIFCTQLSAELISIAGQYWLSEQIPANFVGKAVRLNLRDNALTIQSLN